MADAKRIGFSPAVELSYLKKDEQRLLLDAIVKEEATPSLSQAQRLKRFSQEGKLTADLIDAILSEQKKEVSKITLAGDRLKKYFPHSATPLEMENTILMLLDRWYENNGRSSAAIQ
jgi:ParB family chromosome partitioning protein